MNEQDFRALSALHALHALSPDEERDFSAALAAHPQWQAIVDEDLATAAALGTGIPAVAPPATARRSILDAIEQLPQFDAPAFGASAVPAELDQNDDDSTPAIAGRRRGWLALAASVAVLLAVSLSFPLASLLTPQDPVTVALAQLESAPDAHSSTADIVGAGEATLHWSPSLGQAVLVADGLPEIHQDQDYELWVIRNGEPASLGVLHADSNRNAQTLTEMPGAGEALAVTIEQHGGSPSGAPTSDPILVVSAA